jgi:hypothetical protein
LLELVSTAESSAAAMRGPAERLLGTILDELLAP